MSDEIIEKDLEQNDEPKGILDGQDINVESKNVVPENSEIDHVEKQEEEKIEYERPDWFPQNFWKEKDSEPDIEALSKSWMDMRKIVSTGKHKVPEKYDTSMFKNEGEPDNLQNFVLDWAKDNNVSQHGLESLVKQFYEIAGQEQREEEINVKKEMEMLGQNAEQKINSMMDWTRGLVDKGIWDKDDFEEFKIMAGTSKGFRVIEKLRSMIEPTKIPMQSAPVDGQPTMEELYAKVKDPKYQNDPAYRQQVEREFAKYVS